MSVVCIALSYFSRFLLIPTKGAFRGTRTSYRTSFTFPIPKRLDEVVKLPLFKQQTPETLERLWFAQFQKRIDVSVDILYKSEWQLIKQNLVHSPQFVIPVFKSLPLTSESNHVGDMDVSPPTTPASYFNLFVQFQQGRLGLMTSIEAFRENPSGSPPFAILSFFDDLAESKGLVFVRCDAIMKEHLTKHDLTFCWDYLRAFYSDATLYRECAEKFNHRSRDFDFREFMHQTAPIRSQIYHAARIHPTRGSGAKIQEFLFD